jgi:hypothetical protein
MKELSMVAVVLAGFAILSAIGCAKPPAEEGLPTAQSNRNAVLTNANVHDLTATPLYAHTIRGDVERAGLAIKRARNFAKQEKWTEAVTHLRTALSHIEKALEKKSRLKDEFEGAKTAILKTITTVEGRGSDSDARFEELQTRINALKVLSSPR